METDLNMAGDYFDTPARAERLQLLLHLVRNAGEVLYLRAPSGAGKTRFAHQLLDILGDEMATVWVRADDDCDVPSVAADQLGLSPDDVSPWPDAVMTGLAGQDLLLIIDDADRLGLDAVESLALLHARGGHLLLVGQGGLAQTRGNWDVQFVDLPSFDPVQTVAFLRTQAGEHAGRVTDDLAAGLHRAANGLPGPLLDALHGVLGNAAEPRRVRRAAAPIPEGPRRPLWPWAFGGLILILLLTVLLFQEQINALFSPSDEAGQPQPVVIVEPAGGERVIEPRAPQVPAATEDLRAEAVSALMPEISLPELRREQTPTEIDTIEPAAEATTDGPAVDGQGDLPGEPPATAESVDPLDAVMQDALAAAEAGRQPAPPLAEQAAVTDPVPVEKPSAETASSTGEQPEDPAQPASDVKPETPVVVAPQAAPPPAANESVAKETMERKPEAQEPEPRAVPAPVESRQLESGSSKAPVVGPRPSAAISSESPTRGSKWLESRIPGHYTLQLVGARDRGAVQKFVRDFGITEPYAIFERDLKGKPWYSLVAGDYPDRDAAIAARGRLPKRLERSGVWPRTFASIQKIQ